MATRKRKGDDPRSGDDADHAGNRGDATTAATPPLVTAGPPVLTVEQFARFMENHEARMRDSLRVRPVNPERVFKV